MKFAYQDLLNFLSEKPSLETLSSRLFQLGHEHEFVMRYSILSLLQIEELFIIKWFVQRPKYFLEIHSHIRSFRKILNH